MDSDKQRGMSGAEQAEEPAQSGSQFKWPVLEKTGAANQAFARIMEEYQRRLEPAIKTPNRNEMSSKLEASQARSNSPAQAAGEYSEPS